MPQSSLHAGSGEHLRDADLEHAVEIAPRVWWVGHYIPADPFQCHVYLVYMEATIPHAIALHDRNPQAQLAVLMCDIDHFKAINDTFGHAAGDDVLRQLANMLRHSMRSSDIAVRIGGEEFIIFLLGSAGRDGSKVAERIRAGLSQHCFSQGVGHVTVSIGIAFHRQDDGLENLLRRADAALYRAKRSGRDQVCYAD